MIWFVVAGVLGVICGLFLPSNVDADTLRYVAMALLAMLDSSFGALLAYFNKRFNMSVFVLGLLSNAFLAVVLTYIGDVLGIDLNYAVIIVFGVRIFNNMASIRRLTVDVYFQKRTKEKERIKRLALMAAEEDDGENEADSEVAEGEQKVTEVKKPQQN